MGVDVAAGLLDRLQVEPHPGQAAVGDAEDGHAPHQEWRPVAWTALSEGGEEGPCGWLKDRYGLSWQIVPVRLTELLNDPDEAAAQRVMSAMLQMTKIDIAELERAYAGA